MGVGGLGSTHRLLDGERRLISMATCELCGRRLAFMGKMAAKNLSRMQGLVGSLEHRRSSLEAELQDLSSDERDSLDWSEIEKFRKNVAKMISNGEHYAAQLHSVSHDSGYPGVNYGEIKLWMETVHKVLLAAA